MIEFKELVSKIQGDLNALITNKEFAIFTDVGEYKKAYREEGSNRIDRFINGVAEMVSQTILPIKNLQVVTESVRISFLVDMDIADKDSDGNYVEVINIREILEKYISQANGKPYYLTNGATFEITPTFNGVTVGVATQMSPIGNVLPIYLDFSCVIVESGINTNNVQILVNGENMFYTDYSITRTRTAETNMFAKEKSSKTAIQANSISIQLKMPLLDTNESKNIEEDVWDGGQNEAICLERYRIDESGDEKFYHAYIMVLGNNSETGTLGQNIGQVVDFVEGKRKLLKYNSTNTRGWGNKNITVSQQGTQNFASTDFNGIGNQNTNTWIAFWSNGKVTKTTTLNSGSASFEAGTYTAKVFYYTNPNIIPEEPEE